MQMYAPAQLLGPLDDMMPDDNITTYHSLAFQMHQGHKENKDYLYLKWLCALLLWDSQLSIVRTSVNAIAKASKLFNIQ